MSEMCSGALLIIIEVTVIDFVSEIDVGGI